MPLDLFETAFLEVCKLVENFKNSQARYLSANYQEAEVRKDFIDKFFIALGWDVNHDHQLNPYEQEVKVEPAVTASGQRRADYAFYVSPNYRVVRFFVEAKKPYGDLATSDNYFQTIRYAWNSGSPIAVVTDFHEFHVLDCRYKPDIKTSLSRCVDKYHYLDYSDKASFGKIYWLFSREAVASASLEKRAKELPKPKGKAFQHGLFPGGYQSIDGSFLKELDQYRTALARSFKKADTSLDGASLTEMVQRTLDRLVFIRFLEDKGIEPQRIVDYFGERGTAWEDFVASSRKLDSVYNGIVFKRHPILDSPDFRPDENTFAQICEDIAHVNSPYDFDAIPINILGSIYERFLGNVIVATGKRVRVEQKPEVRKAGGVYYTPDYIVRYIAANTIGNLIEGKSPEEVAELTFADIACGSGSFLLGVFDLLLEYHGRYYNDNPKKASKGDCVVVNGKLYLSLRKKREILIQNIYGVDVDHQAVEVCQLSLYLRLLKDETTGSTHQHLLEFAQASKMKRILPDLSRNIVCGNSLIGSDILNGHLFAREDERKLNPMDFQDAFPQIIKKGGFDVIVGNPPYRMLQPHNTPDEVLSYLRAHYVAAEFKLDFFHLFLQRAVSLLRDGGRLSYIIPTTLLNNVYTANLRSYLMSECCIEQVAVARGRVFADADVHTSVVVLRREADQIKRDEQEINTTDKLGPEFAEHPLFESTTRQDAFGSLPGRIWNILVNDSNFGLIHRLISSNRPLDKMAAINRGLISGDRAKFFSPDKLDEEYVPILTGSDVHRYAVSAPSEFIWFKRPKSAGGCWDPSVHLADHKIVVRQISERPTASIIVKPWAVTGNVFTIRASSLEKELCLLGILNSRVTEFFWRTMFTDFKDSFPQVTIFSLAQVPICDLDNVGRTSLKEELALKVTAMLAAKERLALATTHRDQSYYESRCTSINRQIDQVVYEFFGLSASEVQIVES